MNIILLEGDDFEKMNARLNSFVDSARKRKWEINRISAKNGDVVSKLSSRSLFGIQSLSIINDPEKLSLSDLEWFTTSSKNNESTLIIMKEGALTAKIKSVIPFSKREEFWISQTIWKALDAFYPGNASVFIRLVNQTLVNIPIEFLFAMLGRHVVDLYQILIDEKSYKAPEWKVKKLKSQATKFAPGDLKAFVAQMTKIDSLSKTSDLKLADLLMDSSVIVLS